jgi:glycosyltransferase involved in cell wall biosynthesis
MPPVSIGIVVPSFNQGAFLGEALESIFRQDYPSLEVVVMDGGSTDESVDIIRSYRARLKYWQSQPDDGQSAAINEGVRRVTSELVGWLNSDDFYWGDSLWTVARAYQAHPDHGLYIGNGFRYDQREGTFRPFCMRHLAFNRDALINGLDYVLQPSTFFLREAWDEVNGLDASLEFTMDWDAILRIAERRTAVLINEFLAVSREYEQTKSSSGAMRRAEEIRRVVRKHAGRQITPGSLYYLLETLLSVADETAPHLREHLWGAMQPLRSEFARRWGNADSFPQVSDGCDSVYLPFPTSNPLQRPMLLEGDTLPSISIVMPSLNQAEFLPRALDSVFNQSYPRLEFLVYDGGSSDGSCEILRRRARQLAHWVSEPDRGPAHAINKGLKRATGEILGWLSSDDMLSEGALWEVAKAFAADPNLDLVYGNALYIDERDQLFLADHSSHKTALYYGSMQSWSDIPWYWRYVHAVPQPTVFFRRRLLESCNNLDESYRFIFDFELFHRFVALAKVKKLERVQAFYRIHSSSKSSDWNQFLIELYRFSRPYWPQRISPRFYEIFWDYLHHYFKRRFGERPRSYREWAESLLVSGSLLTKIGNPEKIGNCFVRGAAPQVAATPATANWISNQKCH